MQEEVTGKLKHLWRNGYMFSCSRRWTDCDGDPSNGCEAKLDTDAATCGACDTPAPHYPNTVAPACGNGKPALGTCSAG
jgi:hypothetical protein